MFVNMLFIKKLSLKNINLFSLTNLFLQIEFMRR